jgi:hypothetical protein
MKKLIRNILKEELQGQEFIDNFYEERKRFERTKDEIFNYIKSQHPNLVDVEYKTKKIILASIRIGMETPSIERMTVIFKFVDLKKEDIRTLTPPIKEDIINIFTNYFGFDVTAYGSPIGLEFKAQTWVNF